MKKKVAVLGATGSIGKNTLDILRKERDRFEPVLFSSHTNAGELARLKEEFPGALTALTASASSAAPFLPAAPGGEPRSASVAAEAASPAGETRPNERADFSGGRGLLDAIRECGADITVNGIAGAAGLEPSAAVIQAGSDLALANKETIVMAGRVVKELAKQHGVNIIPVDSEHSAVFRLLEAHGTHSAAEIILTASGGPFRQYPPERLRRVTPEEALAHPTWNMGPKITVDSATLANKGLEVIEAAFLFGFSPEKIKVVIHPQSIVHSMIRLKNGAVYAQMSRPDMKLPIRDALSWPDTEESPYGVLDFDSLDLRFEKCDMERFPMLALAYQALRDGGFSPAVYNAANEVAVASFFKGEIGFLEIPRVVGYVLDKSSPAAKTDEREPGKQSAIEAVLERDREARKIAEEFISKGSI